MGPIDNKSSLVQILGWRRAGDKPLSEPTMTQFNGAYMRLGASMCYWVKHGVDFTSKLQGRHNKSSINWAVRRPRPHHLAKSRSRGIWGYVAWSLWNLTSASALMPLKHRGICQIPERSPIFVSKLAAAGLLDSLRLALLKNTAQMASQTSGKST